MERERSQLEMVQGAKLDTCVERAFLSAELKPPDLWQLETALELSCPAENLVLLVIGCSLLWQ